MSIPTSRSATVLLVIDVQKGVMEYAYNNAEVTSKISSVVDQARQKSVPIVWVQHSDEEMTVGSEWWQIVDELQPAETDDYVRKTFRSAFDATDLDEILERLNARHLVIAGAETNNCVRYTIHSALERGYDITLVSDAHTTSGWPRIGDAEYAATIIAEQNQSVTELSLPTCSANTAEASVVFANS